MATDLKIEQPLVSVLTTSYNRANYIADCIKSVLASTYRNFELIIVDDGSTDNTVAIARAFEKEDSRVKVYVNEKNLGDYPNRNKAASYATGKYIKYLDADDTIYPYGLEAMVNAMEQFPEAGFGLAAKPEDTRPYPVCIEPKEIYLEHFYGYGHFDRGPGSAIIKTSCFREAGGFSGKQFIGDQELWIVMARQFAMVKFPFDLYWNRLHEQQQVKIEMKAGNSVADSREQLIKEALLHNDCPLSETEIAAINKAQKRMKMKGKVVQQIKKIVGK